MFDLTGQARVGRSIEPPRHLVYCFSQKFKIIQPGFISSSSRGRGSQFPYYPIPPLLFGRQNMGQSSSANLKAAEDVTQYAGCTPRWNVQGAGYVFPPMKCQRLHLLWPSHVQPTLRWTFCYFSPCLPLLSKMLDFPDWQCFAHRKTVAFWRSRWRVCRSHLKGNFCRGLSWEWRVPWCRTESRRRRESTIFHHSF